MFPLQTTVVSRHPPVMTWALIGINALVFYFELNLPEVLLERVTYLFGVVPARFTHPHWAIRTGFPADEYWPFLTSTFLHGGWTHIIGNMWTLWLFGQSVEDRMGAFRFLAFYLLCGITSGIVHVWVNADSVVPAIGASGAIAGVMGAYLVLFPASRVIVMVPVFIFPLLFDFPAVFYLGYWFLLQLISGSVAVIVRDGAGGIAFWAHVGGFVAGLLLIPLFVLWSGKHTQLFHRDEGTYEHGWKR